MSETAISCENLSKRFRLGNGGHSGYRTLRDSIAGLFTKQARTPVSTQEIWALKDVTFEIAPGEVVGLIGRNGAGKSTLLKILSRITEPTSGRAVLKGRLASLLEVGTGFHPELTGRENVFLSGAVLGMSRAEVVRSFDEIVAFAEIERFLETPVKRYSSGMYVRLAFAVAAHLTPEILLVDEVLAVGDAAFQKKCLGRMGDVARSGRTVVFVSHSMPAIERLCERALWLDRGQLALDDQSRVVIGTYLKRGTASTTVWRPAFKSEGPFQYRSISVSSRGAHVGSDFAADQPLDLAFEYDIVGTLPPGRLSFLLTNFEGQIVMTSASSDGGEALDDTWPRGSIVNRCTIPGGLLMPGTYHLTSSEPDGIGGNRILDDILSFSISEIGSVASRDGRKGYFAPRLEWISSIKAAYL